MGRELRDGTLVKVGKAVPAATSYWLVSSDRVEHDQDLRSFKDWLLARERSQAGVGAANEKISTTDEQRSRGREASPRQPGRHLRPCIPPSANLGPVAAARLRALVNAAHPATGPRLADGGMHGRR
jgi:hypothetical protein